jgi:hypothetical protein
MIEKREDPSLLEKWISGKWRIRALLRKLTKSQPDTSEELVKLQKPTLTNASQPNG